MSILKNQLIRACDELGLAIESEFVWTAGDGRVFRPLVRLSSVGPPSGMLVFLRYDEFKAYADEIVQAGFGYSVLSELSSRDEYDLAGYEEMFADWDGKSND